MNCVSHCRPSDAEALDSSRETTETVDAARARENGTSVTDHGTPRPLIVLSKWNNSLPKRNNSPSKRNVSLFGTVWLQPFFHGASGRLCLAIRGNQNQFGYSQKACRQWCLQAFYSIWRDHVERFKYPKRSVERPCSLDRIRRITGVPKTTVKRIIDQSKA